MTSEIKDQQLAVIEAIPNVSPLIPDSYVALTVYIEGRLFFLRTRDWKINKQTVMAFFRKLAELSLYTGLGKPTFNYAREIDPEFRPSKIVDHVQLTKLQSKEYSLDQVTQDAFGEEFCNRTVASPKHSSISQLAREHLILRNRLLHDYASNHISTKEWETAVGNTVELFFKRKRKNKIFRK